MNFSIVIPTWNRSELVEDLLKSLFEERNRYSKGKTEVLIVDSSKDKEKENIVNSCNKYDAQYIDGDDSVRKKRNKGIRMSQYDYILFIDSDVVVEQGLLDEYVEAFKNPYKVNLGGVLGYTEFVGEKTFWWKMLEKTSFVDSFSFARNYPFHSWTIGNNVSFKKSVLEEIGMFEESFPFKLGGDDLDMTYRVTKAGYMIGSAPNAVTYHSRKTWNNYKAVHDRAKRWGTMENYIVERHPELYMKVIPKDYIIEAVVGAWLIFLALICQHLIPVIVLVAWLVVNRMVDYAIDIKKSGFSSPVFYFGARIIQDQYEYYRVKKSLQKHSLSAFYKGIVFNRFQIKHGMANESARIKKLMATFIGVALIVMLVSRFV